MAERWIIKTDGYPRQFPIRVVVPEIDLPDHTKIPIIPARTGQLIAHDMADQSNGIRIKYGQTGTGGQNVGQIAPDLQIEGQFRVGGRLDP